MHELAGKTALVTGAAGGIGRATVAALLEDGVRVSMVDRDGERLEAASRHLEGDTFRLPLDVSDPTAVEDAHRRLAADFGPVDILVNNAGVLSNDKAGATTPEEWRRVMAVNLDGAFYLSRAVLPHMRSQGWGRIVNTCSLASKTGGLTAGTAYSTSKGALVALTFSLAREVAGDGVTVNGIAPAYVNTPMVTEQLDEAQRQRLLDEIPVGRFCEPEEFAHVVRFLVSPLSGFITGEVIDQNGGLHFD
jgi:3-oxoacyl-[acyl-carrier protein] reductase